MDILEELKQQNQSTGNIQNKEHSDLECITNPRHFFLFDSLKGLNDYLIELISNLNKTYFDTSAEIHIPGYGSIINLSQRDYRLSWINDSISSLLQLDFTTFINGECRIELSDGTVHDAVKILDDLQVKYKQTDDNLDIKGKFTSSIIFSASIDHSAINVTIINVKQPGNHYFLMDKSSINNDFFDQFGRFLLHRENNFIEFVEPRDSEAEEKDTEDNIIDFESAISTKEINIGHGFSLFSKTARLYLTYHNTIKDIYPNYGDFIMGRSRQCDITVNSDFASRQHARIVYRKGKYVLIDQSTNGTFAKVQGNKEVYVQGEELPLSGSGFISLGRSVTIDNEHIIYYSCQ